MELNRTTLDIDFYYHDEPISQIVRKTHVDSFTMLKLFKNKNGFFSSYRPIKFDESEKNTVLVWNYKVSNQGKLLYPVVFIIYPPGMTMLELVLLPSGRIIDDRLFKTTPKQKTSTSLKLNIDKGAFLKVDILNRKSGKLFKTIKIMLSDD